MVVLISNVYFLESPSWFLRNMCKAERGPISFTIVHDRVYPNPKTRRVWGYFSNPNPTRNLEVRLYETRTRPEVKNFEIFQTRCSKTGLKPVKPENPTGLGLFFKPEPDPKPRSPIL